MLRIDKGTAIIYKSVTLHNAENAPLPTWMCKCMRQKVDLNEHSSDYGPMQCSLGTQTVVHHANHTHTQI